MLSFQDSPTRLCNGVSRREILRVGGLSLLGLSLSDLASAREETDSQKNKTFGRAKNVIFLYLAGGPPQQETFDPKPNAPADIRGEFQPISTNVPGIQFCELLPRTARVANHLAVVRSMSTNDSIHSSSGAWVLTGHKYSGTNARTIQPSDWPYFGSIVKMLKPSEALPSLSTVWIPDWCRLNENVKPAGQTGGLLGRLWDPERFIGDPSQSGYRVDGLNSSNEVLSRLKSRRELLNRLDRGFDRKSMLDFRGIESANEQAFSVLTSGKAANAFKIDKEPAKLREKYGMNRWGQCVLLARRLIESGVRLVHVQWPRMPGDNAVDNPLWDTHAQNFDRLEDVLCPVFDVGFSALIEDLHDRGLLDETLVVAIGEFGRTPKINAKAGRDHWGNVFSCALAGAGISGGQVFGASDNHAAYPIEDRVEPGDLIATIYHLLGIDHNRLIFADDGRGIPMSHGKPISKLLGLHPATKERIKAGGDPLLVPPYRERLLNFSDWPHGVEVRTFEGSSRPKTWRADPLPVVDFAGLGFKFINADEDDSKSRNSQTKNLRKNVRHLLIGAFGSSSKPIEIRANARALITQEVRSPFAGTFVLQMIARPFATSPDEFKRFLAHFRLRMMLIQFATSKKNPSQHTVLAELDLASKLSQPESGQYQAFQVKKTFSPAQPGQNISFGAGLGIGVSLEPKSSEKFTIPAGAQAIFTGIRVAKIELEFEGKKINKDVQV